MESLKMTTIICEMFIVKIFYGKDKPRKFNTQIFVCSTNFIRLIFLGCHEPQNILTQTFYIKKIQDAKFDTKSS